ncbi:predicted protein [Uncinocarpus reesii 1704]|uniref:Uncharacterized protein n=1 Tax=Uncinocarpus reesii (strain UAMH 1704) TaxID=336963 RepID=C4JXY4_UNCRE|nr:uncharacterized protein UREG_07035 [Uncinocarpus reesii 1704]EEP82170.1 predicted protein [Uncinocarpus reesii 1704]
MPNIKKLKLGERAVVRIRHEIQLTIHGEDATSQDVQIPGFPPPSPSTQTESAATETPSILSDSFSHTLSLPSTPSPMPLVLPSGSIPDCGSCSKFGNSGIMRICRPCSDIDTDAFVGGESPALITPGVLAVVLILLFLVAVALVDFTEWIRGKLRSGPSVALPESEKSYAQFEDWEEEYIHEDDQLIP